jgi:soluble lytic murein transglycosylase-like protein
MSDRTWMRRFSAALVLAATLSLFPTPGPASAGTGDNKPYHYVSNNICPIEWRRGPRQVKRLVRCTARHWGVSIRTALHVAQRESNFRHRAYNGSSCASGIFQHLCHYWPGRARVYGFRNRSAFNARANIIVTMRMVRRGGWDPWGY